MNSLLILTTGALLIYLSFSDMLPQFIKATGLGEARPVPSGYKTVDLTKFLLAGIVVTVPAIFLEQSKDEEMAWYYVGLIILSMLVFYNEQVKRFVTFLGGSYVD